MFIHSILLLSIVLDSNFNFLFLSVPEKHKSYHIKDEQLSRDGFKKFMKNEVCPYENCKFSKVCNHIHCIRPQCHYVLHSSGQLFSHKRKHERQDSELAYRKYKLAQSMMKTLQDGGMPVPPFPREYEQQFEGLNLSLFGQGSTSNHSETLSDRNSPISYGDGESASAIDLTANESSLQTQDESQFNCEFFSQQDSCMENCEHAFSDHYHCAVDNCPMTFT